MIWEISNGGQMATVLFAVLTGIILSIIYDFFKAPRMCKKRTAFRLFWEDMLFGTMAALITFCLLILRTNGQPRMYVFLSMLLGFIVWRLTLSRFLIAFLIALLKLLFCGIDKLRAFFYKSGQKTAVIMKKVFIFLKKGLKGIKRLLYNQLRKYRSAKPNDIRQDED